MDPSPAEPYSPLEQSAQEVPLRPLVGGRFSIGCQLIKDNIVLVLLACVILSSSPCQFLSC
jgi:hypothetical protein